MSDIVNYLFEGNLMICLVDWSLLECIWCDRVVSGLYLLIYLLFNYLLF